MQVQDSLQREESAARQERWSLRFKAMWRGLIIVGVLAGVALITYSELRQLPTSCEQVEPEPEWLQEPVHMRMLAGSADDTFLFYITRELRRVSECHDGQLAQSRHYVRMVHMTSSNTVARNRTLLVWDSVPIRIVDAVMWQGRPVLALQHDYVISLCPIDVLAPNNKTLFSSNCTAIPERRSFGAFVSPNTSTLALVVHSASCAEKDRDDTIKYALDPVTLRPTPLDNRESRVFNASTLHSGPCPLIPSYVGMLGTEAVVYLGRYIASGSDALHFADGQQFFPGYHFVICKVATGQCVAPEWNGTFSIRRVDNTANQVVLLAPNGTCFTWDTAAKNLTTSTDKARCARDQIGDGVRNKDGVSFSLIASDNSVVTRSFALPGVTATKDDDLFVFGRYVGLEQETLAWVFESNQTRQYVGMTQHGQTTVLARFE